MTESKPPESIPLQYGPRTALPWVSRHRRKLIALAVVVAVALTARLLGPTLVFRAKWLYWSHRCAVYQMPPQMPVVVTDPQKVAAMFNSRNPDWGYERILNGGWTAASFTPHAVTELLHLDNGAWSAMGVLFVGSLHRPDGKQRVVVLSSPYPNGSNLAGCLNTLVMTPVPLFQKIPSRFGKGSRWTGPWMELHWYTAVPDAADQSHLRLHFDMMVLTPPTPASVGVPVPGDVDVYLQNDDALRFKLRDAPQLQKYGAALGYDAAGRLVDATKSTTGLIRN
jgi:hypothetical protein